MLWSETGVRNIPREDKLGRLTYGDLTYKSKPMEESFMSVWV